MIGNKIRQRRLELGLTQEELALRLGYKSKSTINKIELNKHDISQSKLVRFAVALEVPTTYFIESSSQSDIPYDAVMKYAEILSKLPPQKLENVMQYIDFVNQNSSLNE